MKDQIKNEVLNQIGGLADIAKEGLVKLVETIQAEAPELCEQILAWGFWCSLIWFIFWAICIVTVPILTHKLVMCIKKKDLYDGACMYNILWSEFFIVAFLLASTGWLKILIAPKLYLIQYISEIIK